MLGIRFVGESRCLIPGAVVGNCKIMVPFRFYKTLYFCSTQSGLHEIIIETKVKTFVLKFNRVNFRANADILL